MRCSRRDVLGLAGGLAAWPAFRAWPAALAAVPDELLGEAKPFTESLVADTARDLSAKPYVEALVKLPPELKDLTYQQYHSIQFRPDQSVWSGEARNFALDLFHPGFLFKVPVEISIVENGKARALRYTPELFRFGPQVAAPPKDTVLPYAGFRLRHPLNRAEYWDEFMVFLGASYFRAIARNQVYGLSARGLAIGTASPRGEEFPAFRQFWIKRPDLGATSIAAQALLDSPSTTGAFRFTIRPGEITQVDVESIIFPRRDLDHVGFAPLTSMFLFDGVDRSRFDDARPAVHDSDGLAIWTGAGEWLWRPLANPTKLQISAFGDSNLRGFGLLQRKRNFGDFQDLEDNYQRRPSLWVEPVGDWGAGHVELIEIPSNRELNDNIVAYWRPRGAIPKGSAYLLTYRLHWCAHWPVQAAHARTVMSRAGQAGNPAGRNFAVDFIGGDLSGDVRAELSTSTGAVTKVTMQPNPHTGGYRVSFELENKDIDLAELRLRLVRAGAPVSETWLYRWTRPS